MKSFLLFLPEIEKFLEMDNVSGARQILQELHSVDIAEGFQEIGLDMQLRIFSLLDMKKAIEVFEGLEMTQQVALLDSMTKDRAGKVLNGMSADERADLFSELSRGIINRLFGLMKPDEVNDVLRLMKYEEDTAGGLMTTEFVSIGKDFTVGEALDHLKKEVDVETIYETFVVDEYGHLLGKVSIQTLIVSEKDTPIKDIMDPNVIKVGVNLDQEDVARLFARYDLMVLPVTDDDNKILGIITADDILDVVEMEATEDIYKMVGTSIKEEPLLEGPVLKRASLRLPWLFTCVMGGLLCGLVIKFFHTTLDRIFATLTFFIPIIMDMSGNVGTQSSTIMVRSLATGGFDLRRLKKVLLKEILVGLIMGMGCGVIVGVAAPFLGAKGVGFGLIVGLAIWVALTFASFVGVLTPMLFKTLNVDPAIAAGPFVTTCVDFAGLVIYFGIATLLISLLHL
jgi:magnesium transporter